MAMKPSGPKTFQELWHQVQRLADVEYDGAWSFFSFGSGFKGGFGTPGETLWQELFDCPNFEDLTGLLIHMLENQPDFYREPISFEDWRKCTSRGGCLEYENHEDCLMCDQRAPKIQFILLDDKECESCSEPDICLSISIHREEALTHNWGKDNHTLIRPIQCKYEWMNIPGMDIHSFFKAREDDAPI